jgi:FkbM family methyltransferase
MMTILNGVKHRLLQAGPESLMLRTAFQLQAAARGFSMHVASHGISLVRGRHEMMLNRKQLIFVPFAIHSWETWFETIETRPCRGRALLDFSTPALHRYRKSGLSFYFPSFAEDDCMDAYTAAYRPQPGDVVWDVGAHAGMTSCLLAQMVGPRGLVYAFEPDEVNFQYLLRNLGKHRLANVIPVKAALSGRTGTANFCMDGTMGAGLCDSLSYSPAEHCREVETFSLPDACAYFGAVPDFIKMDIEGAEVSVIAAALRFLRSHPVQLSIETNHRVDGRPTSGVLDVMLSAAGYRAWSSDRFGQRFTWAVPSTALLKAAEKNAAGASMVA